MYQVFLPIHLVGFYRWVSVCLRNCELLHLSLMPTHR